MGTDIDKPIRVDRQAIVIIHGIGEQRPMETMRGFAESLIKLDAHPSDFPIWSRPDFISEGFEHRRLTLTGTRNRPKADVYELYWAHLFEQRDYSTFWAWATRLGLRRFSDIPKRMHGYLNWLIFFVFLFAGLLAILWYLARPLISGLETLGSVAVISGVVSFIVTLITHKFNVLFLGTISDAARYLNVSPRNVKSRNAVRKLGVEFLEKMHAKTDPERGGVPYYDRIIVAGHSLGSVVGYDILQHYWYRQHEQFDQTAKLDHDRLKEFETLLRKLQDGTLEFTDEEALSRIRAHQEALWGERRLMSDTWRVTDFITLGSPLAYADVLMAESEIQFIKRRDQEEFPMNPPKLDAKHKNLTEDLRFENAAGQPRTIKLLKHSAMFAITRWTNIYFPIQFGLLGDPIGGPLKRLFGGGVLDIEVKTPGHLPTFAHLKYWDGECDKSNPNNPLNAIRLALDLETWSYGADVEVNDGKVA